MTIFKVDPIIANPKHGGRIGGVDGSCSQSIEYHDHDIAGLRAHGFYLPRNKSQVSGPESESRNKADQKLFQPQPTVESTQLYSPEDRALSRLTMDRNWDILLRCNPVCKFCFIRMGLEGQRVNWFYIGAPRFVG